MSLRAAADSTAGSFVARIIYATDEGQTVGEIDTAMYEGQCQEGEGD